MAKYKVDISSYDKFRAATIGNWYDVDGVYGAQCVDSAKLLWEQLGRACSTGGTGGAYGCWTAARTANAGKDFDLITDKTKIKRGDVVVWGEGLCKYGHIGFADADYKAGQKLPCYSQNQGGTDGQGAASAFCVKSYATAHILGAFRLKKWAAVSTKSTAPTTNTPTKTATVKSAVAVGKTVKVKSGAKSYEGKSIAAFVYKGKYKVDELKGNRAVLDKKGICTAFKTSDLEVL